MDVTLPGASESLVTITMRADQMRSDLVRGLVWFVNYAALDPSAVRAEHLDLHNTAMMPEDVEKFAHRWLSASRSVDIEHDGIGRPVHVVESFYNSEDIAAPAFPINSHAARLDVSRSKEAMDGLRSGRLNSVSLDALTFNRVVRLPAAQTRSAFIADGGWDLAGWARELAQDGWTDVLGVREIGDGLFVASRKSGMPIAIQVHEDGFESAAAGGAWGRLGMAAFDSPSLVRMDLAGGEYTGARVIDHTQWDPSVVSGMLAEVGVPIDGNISRVGPLEKEIFAAIERPSGSGALGSTPGMHHVPGETPQAAARGFLPHHTVREGRLMVSRDGVARSLAMVDSLPSHLRESARAHLLAHLDAMRGT
jgi:hypothetical protein